MKKIINNIYNHKNGFFNKELLTDNKIIENINKIRDILQRWFSGEFEYNYFIKNNTNFNFYILYNNKLYTYSIFFKDKKLFNISLLAKNIIRNLPYFLEISYFCNGNILDILKYIPKKPYTIFTFSKQYNKKNILCYVDIYEDNINKRIQINNNNIKDVYYCSTKYKKSSSQYKYIYNDNYIYSYQEIASNYSSKFCGTYRFVKLFI